LTTCLALFVLAFLIGLVATVGVRRAALWLGVVDRPDNFRKVHDKPMPRLGGVAVFAAFVVPLLVLYALPGTGLGGKLHEEPVRLFGLLLAAGITVATGAADDAWGLRPRWKLLFQACAASIAVSSGFAIEVINNPFGAPMLLGWLSFPVSVFWLLCCMNGVNLLDGLDGLAAGVCLVVSITLFLVALTFGQLTCMVFTACLSGAILAFLVFNFHPASIFLGDSGSLLLGLLVGAISLAGAAGASGGATQLIPVIALGLPLFDTALAVLRRWCRKLPVSAADRNHVHHALMAVGLSHKRVVLVLYGACVALGGAALIITMKQAELTVLVLGSLGVVGFVCVRVVGGLRFGDVWGRVSGELARRERTAEAKVSVERSVARMRVAPTIDAVWAAVAEGFAGMGFDVATLRLYPTTGGQPRTLTWRAAGGEPAVLVALEPDIWSVRLAVHSDVALGDLEAAKAVGHGPLLAEAPELLDRLRRELAARIGLLDVTDGEDTWERFAPVPRLDSALPMAEEAVH